MNTVEPRLLVTIDTECDKSKTWRTASPLTFRGVTETISNRLQPLFARHGIRPTYLISPEVMTHPESVAALKEARNVELTTHLHGDYIVPQIKSWDFAGSITDEMQWEYGATLERAKMATLTEMFRQQFGHQPLSFRAGRFGAGPDTGKILHDLGYKIDSSVSPHVCWTSRTGQKRPDYRGYTEMPYSLGLEGDLSRAGNGGLLELPVTILPAGTVASNTANEPIWFRPWYSDADTLKRVLDHVIAQPPVNGVHRPLVMMFHNVELLAGASPYPQSESEVQQYLDMMAAVFELAEKRGVKSCTMAEYEAYHAENTGRTAPKPQANASLPIELTSKPLKPEIELDLNLVETTLDRHGVQPWFKYVFKDRPQRWDCWKPCFWLAKNIPKNVPILSIGTGVGFNLFWLAEYGFTQLHGTDIDPKAVTAGNELAVQAKLPITLAVDDALAPKAFRTEKYGVIEALNWTHLVEGFSLDRLLNLYEPLLTEDGVFILDSIDEAYNRIPGNQYSTQDRNKPESERRPSEYRTRFSVSDIRNHFARHGLSLLEIIREEQVIPKTVYIGRRIAATAATAGATVPAMTEAEIKARHLMAKEPCNLEALTVIIASCLDNERWVEAADFCYRILHLTPDNLDVLRALSHCLEQTNEAHTARAVNNRIQKLEAATSAANSSSTPVESNSPVKNPTAVSPSPAPHLPRILMIADVPNWIFERHARTLHAFLSDEFDLTLCFRGNSFNEADYDLIYPLEWNLVNRELIRNPKKWITGIRSHCSWDKEVFADFIGRLRTDFQRVHVVSERLRELFAAHLPNVCSVSHGVDTSHFTPTARTQRTSKTLRLGWAGNRMSPNKGFKEIIEPLGNLPGVELVFCGYSDRNLTFAEMRDFYNTVDAYVCASDFEGNNNSLLEAAAMTCAIITTNNGTVPEYLSHGKNALIVERTLPAFKQAVEKLRDNPALCLELGTAARTAVVAQWDWRVKAESYRTLFREALIGAGYVQSAPVTAEANTAMQPASAVEVELHPEIAAELEKATAALQAGDFPSAYKIYHHAFKAHPENDRLRDLVALATSEARASHPLPDLRGQVKPTRVNLAILTFNALEYTKLCLSSLKHNTSVSYNVFVVDNGSTDGTREWFAEQTDTNLFVEFSPINLGVPGGRNRLIQLIQPHLPDDGFIVFIDNDLEMLPGWSGHYLDLFEAHPEAGVAGKIGHDIIIRGHTRELLPAPNAIPASVDVASGGFACWIRAATIKAVGFFDEKLGLFWHEDDDYSVRAIAAGWEVFGVPLTQIIHHEHKSGVATPGSVARGGSPENIRYLIQKWQQLGYVDASGRIIHPARNNATLVQANTPKRKRSGVIVIGVDGRTFYHSGSTARGIGHYALHHFQTAAQLRPDWRFVVYVEADRMNKTMERLVALPNVRVRLIDAPDAEEMDLFHIPDPMNLAGGFDSPMRLFPHIPSTAILYDITPLRYYWNSFPEMTRDAYMSRLNQFRQRNLTLLSISEYSRQDFLKLKNFPAEKVVTIMAGLNKAEQKAEITPEMVKQVRAKYGITQQFFLHVGALDPHKNFETVIQAMGQIPPKISVQLVVVGEKENHLKAVAEFCEKNKTRNIFFVGFIPRRDLEILYHDAAALLFLSRYEGFGFPVLEAMAQGCPVITTNVSSIPEVAGSAALTYSPDDKAGISEGMQKLLKDRKLREELRVKGLAQAADFPWTKPAQKTIEIWEKMLGITENRTAQDNRAAIEINSRSNQPLIAPAAPVASAVKASTDSPKVAWHGSFLDHGSLSLVNRELTSALTRHSTTNLTLVKMATSSAASAPTSEAMRALATKLSSKSPDDVSITVRHQWPPDWSRPAQGALVVIQPWEFGILPESWVQQSSDVDEFWVPSNYVRQCYITSGIDAEKVCVVPNGIDPERFNPSAPASALTTKKKFKFLFVGGTISRKGPDILLKAYLENFTGADDVCLVIKDFGGKSVYAGQTLEARIKEAQAQPDAPEILYLNEELPPEALPSLYTACDCLVHPYRGEGFGLPVLEAMACGLPVIVTAGGSTDDFATDQFAYRIPATKQFIGDSISGMKLIGKGWMLEPSITALSDRMKWIIAHREEARELGSRASAHVRREWTWERSAVVAKGRLQAIATRPVVPASISKIRTARKLTPMALPAVAKTGELTNAQDLFRKKSPRAAWESAREAIKARPHHPEAFLLLAEIARMVGDATSARHCAQHALKLAPAFKPVKKFLKANLIGTTKLDWLVLPPEVENKNKQAKPRVSACLIVKNEERFIGQCLASIKGLVDQIVVVDTGSTDRTIAIAKEHGAEIHAFDWCNDFSAARNAALQHVTGDWILSLDADEELLPESHAAFRRLLEDDTVISWRLPLFDIGRESEGCNYVPRLFRNAPGLHFVGRVHEQIFYSVEARRIEWGLENKIGDATLRHHGYTKELIKERGKIERNLRLLEQAVTEITTDPLLFMNYGLELCRSDRVEEGLQQYQIAFEMMSQQPASNVTPETREALLTQYCTHLRIGKRPAEVLPILTSPLARSGDLTASQHFILGLAHMELEQFPAAAQQMRQCLAKREQPAFTPINPDIRTAIPRHSIALCLWQTKDLEGAEEAFLAAAAEAPDAVKVHIDYARFLHEQAKTPESLQLLNQFVSDHSNAVEAWTAGGKIALSEPNLLEVAGDWTTVAINHHPDDTTLVAQHAEALFLAGKLPEALPLWSKLAAPANPRALAAQIFCETALGTQPKSLPPHVLKTVTQEFDRWYWRLVEFGAEAAVLQLHASVDALENVLPEAARSVHGIIAKLAVTEAV